MHVMLDLETMGKRAGAVILSIGAVAFDENGPTQNQFHRFLKIQDQMSLGAHLDPETVIWWLGQNDDARKGITTHQESAGVPYHVLSEFADWYRAAGGTEIWGNGSDFDLPLLGDMLTRFKVAIPWKYNAGRCCRTIMALVGAKMGDFGTKNALAHDALADAIYQAGEVAGAMRRLRYQKDQARAFNAAITAGAESQ